MKKAKSHHEVPLAPEPLPEKSGVLSQRICAGACGQPIPTARLQAQPGASMCVPCLEAAGDVAPIRRFDDITADGERVEILFTRNRAIEGQINRRNHIIASQDAFDIAVGDDSHLGHEENEILDGARSLSTVFEDEPQERYKTVVIRTVESRYKSILADHNKAA